MATRDEYVAIIKHAFVVIGGKAALTALTAALPGIMANAVAQYIASHIIDYILVAVSDAAEMQVFFIYIDVRTSKQGQDFFSAAKENRDIQKTGTPEEKAHAEKVLIDKFRAFAKLTN